jgi:hypothetical protein
MSLSLCTTPSRSVFSCARPRRLELACLALVLTLASCGDEPLAERTWPPGTVLAIGEIPITVAEVDDAAVPIQVIEPGKTDNYQRTVALTNVVMPRAVARVLAGEERWRAARREVEEALAAIRNGTRVGPPADEGALGELREGGWKRLGLVVWAWAMQAPPPGPPGSEPQFSPILEDIGRFLSVRVLLRTEGLTPGDAQFRVDVIEARYLPKDLTTEQVKSKYDAYRLTFVDPRWREFVPELIQNRMRADKP